MEEPNEDYTFDPFEDGSWKLVGEEQKEKMRTFVSDYVVQLRDIEEALDESLSEVWDSQTDPLSLNLEPYEQIHFTQLIKTDNKVFNKILTVFGSLCSEVRMLTEIAEQKFYGPLLMFGEIFAEPDEGDVQLWVGKMLPFLVDLSNYVNRCYEVVQNFVRQFAKLYHSQQKQYPFKNVHLQTVFESLSKLLSILITLDELIQGNYVFASCWGKYKRMTKAIKSAPAKYSAEEDQLWQLEKLLYSLKGQLMDGLIYQNCIEQEFDFPGLVEVRNNKVFKNEFFLNVKSLIPEGTQNREKLPGITGLYIFYMILFKDPSDKKFFRSFWDVYKTVPMVHLIGNLYWFPTEFIKKSIPVMVKLVNANTVSGIQAFLKNSDKNFESNVKSLYLQVSIWMARIESNLTNRADLSSILTTRTALLTQGLNLAHGIGDLFKTTVGLHIELSSALSKSDVKGLCQCVEMLKAIQGTFHRKSAVIGESISLMAEQICGNLQRLLVPVEKRLGGGKNFSDVQLDILAAGKYNFSD